MENKRTCIYLTSEQIEKLEARKKTTGTSVSEIIRRAINEYLKKVVK